MSIDDMSFPDILIDAGIQVVVSVPDSLNSKIVDATVLSNYSIKYIQPLNEISAVAISSGINLTGDRAVCIMENSGFRYACDIITRFEMAQGIHNIYLLSNRGSAGEENWWGVFHNEIISDIIEKNHMKSIEIEKEDELSCALKKALRTFGTEQVSVVVLLNYDFYEGIQ